MAEEVTKAKAEEQETLPSTLPNEVYIVASQNIAHGGRSEWMGTQGRYQFSRGGIYRINHPIDIVYFMSNPKQGLDVYLEKDLPSEIDPDTVIEYSYPVDKIDVNADRGAGLGSILDEAQKRYERLF